MAIENKERRIVRLMRENPTLAAKYGRGEISLRKAEKAAGLVPKDLSIASADVDKAVLKLTQHYGADVVGRALRALSENEQVDHAPSVIKAPVSARESIDDLRLEREIIEELTAYRKTRSPFFLSLNDLEKLGQWIDANRYDPSGRTRNTHHRQRNTDAEVRDKTMTAFSTDNPDRRIEALTQLKGVAEQTAIRILALVERTE